MVNNVFAKQVKYSKNLRHVIPVVADTFVLNESAFAPPEGITELIDACKAGREDPDLSREVFGGKLGKSGNSIPEQREV
jgi:hypothetical protein